MVLKTNISTCGNLRKYKKTVDNEIHKWAKKFGIKTYDHSVQIDHVHFNMLISSIDNYKKFIRALAGRLAQLLKVKFRYRPFTKLIRWGRQFKNVANYIIQNEEEITGVRPYKARQKRPQKALFCHVISSTSATP